MGRLSQEVIAAIRVEMAAAAHGQKTALADHLGARFGVSRSTIYKHAEVGGTPRERELLKPQHLEWAATAVALAHRNKPALSLELALESCISAGLLPPEAAGMPLTSAYNALKRQRLNTAARRTQQLVADYPLQAIQIDGSTSAWLIPHEPVGDGDWLLRIHRKPTPAYGYKNKPLGPGRMRVTATAIWDMCTGLVRYEYHIAQGENAIDMVTALVTMLADGSDPLRPMHGVPCNLWTDQGPVFKGRLARDLIGRLGIALVTGKPYHKERQGGVERAWRTLWRGFERPLLEEARDTITLSEITARLVEFERRLGRRPARQHPGGKVVSRADAWQLMMRHRPAGKPLRAMPENALATLHIEDERVIDRSGMIRWQGRLWECPDWHLRRVLVRQSLDQADTLTLEDPATGERSIARPPAPRRYGQVRQVAATPLEKAVAALGDAAGGALYMPGPAPAANVTPLMRPAAAAAALDNPLDAASFASIDDALAWFADWWPGRLAPADIETVRAMITDCGLDRAAVTNLAGDLLAATQHRSNTS